MNSQKKKTLALATACGVCVVGVAYSIYTYFNQSTTAIEELNDTSTKKIKYTSRSISIIITDSIISSNLPVVEILTQTENITFILPEDLSMDDLLLGESDAIDFNRLKYKIINVDKNESIAPLLSHLNNDLVIYTNNEVEVDLKFVRSDIVELEQNSTSINETILSYMIG